MDSPSHLQLLHSIHWILLTTGNIIQPTLAIGKAHHHGKVSQNLFAEPVLQHKATNLQTYVRPAWIAAVSIRLPPAPYINPNQDPLPEKTQLIGKQPESSSPENHNSNTQSTCRPLSSQPRPSPPTPLPPQGSPHYHGQTQVEV